MVSSFARAYGIPCLIMMAAGATAFVYTPTLHLSNLQALQSSSSRTVARQSLSMAAPLEGAHGMRSRFLPVEQLDDETFAPRTIQIAGALPDITVADIMAVSCNPPSEMGMWQYDFSDPSGPQELLAIVEPADETVILPGCPRRNPEMGTVAVPGSEVAYNMIEPVAIVTPNLDLNIFMPEGESTELLMVVDRADREFVVGKFFLWTTPESTLQVRYFEDSPAPGYDMVGRVGLVLVPHLPSMRRKSTGFEEEEY